MADNTDCDDSNTGINPDSDEVCDLEDNNCDGDIDEASAVDAQLWYADNDSDGYGNLNNSQYSCYQPQGYLLDNTDCDDGDNDIFPGAPELCSTSDDDNCDGTINENTATDALTWYADSDGDGFGDSNSPSNPVSNQAPMSQMPQTAMTPTAAFTRASRKPWMMGWTTIVMAANSLPRCGQRWLPKSGRA